MRKNLPIILLSALVVIGLLVGVGYYFQTYRHGKAPEEGLTVVTAESTTASNKRTFLAENKEGDFQLYAQGDKAILVHQGKSKTFSGWSHYLTKERPKLYYTDLNGDKKKELVVRLVSGIDRSTGQELYTYDLYVLTPHKQKDGSFEYDLVVADRESWKRPFTQAVKCSVTQLKNDPMRVQVAMGNASGSLSFDEKPVFPPPSTPHFPGRKRIRTAPRKPFTAGTTVSAPTRWRTGRLKSKSPCVSTTSPPARSRLWATSTVAWIIWGAASP